MKKYNTLGYVSAIILAVFSIFTYTISRRSDPKGALADLLLFLVISASLAIPATDESPKLPKWYAVRLVLAGIGLIIAGYILALI